jgi:hypothetical protein
VSTLRTLVTFTIASALAGGAAAAAESANRPLCDFVQKVLAAKPTEFNTLKGEHQNQRVFGDEVFKGTLLPSPGMTCTLFVRTRVGRAELEPKYSCKIGSAQNLTEATGLFTRAAADLRACFSQARFSNDYEGDGKNAGESVAWTMTGEGPDYRLELEMSNRVALVARAMGQTSGDELEIAITLDVTDTSPPRTPI